MNRLTIRARSIARHLGFVRLYHKLRSAKNYEEKFHRTIVSELRPGDLVWDIGANVGFYTKIFGEKTGPSGQVVAFEPSPETYAQLCRLTTEYPWVRAEQMALSNFDGTGTLMLSKFSPLNHLKRAGEQSGTADSVQVRVLRGDSYWAVSGKTPSVIKIDVEGFEVEVLAGLDALLSASELRVVFLEVHFMELEKRGDPDAPARIEKLLQSKGFQAKWADSSHIVARR